MTFGDNEQEVTMRFLKTQVSFTRLGCREFKRPARDLADPHGAHELETRVGQCR